MKYIYKEVQEQIYASCL